MNDVVPKTAYKESEEIDNDVEMSKRYYKTKKEAEAIRRKGERVYKREGKGYYIVRPKRRKSFWDVF
ncbi:MAG: hypothetical protein KAU03_03065 [Candidatus Altiarchaeales archaeon]|nr:hypothetical protein [Candidatus Altiarchaeales archaeon]